MAKVVPIQLNDGTILYIEGQSGTESPELPSPVADSGEQRRTGAKGLGSLTQGLRIDPAQSMEMVQSTIRTYTQSCLSAFKNMNVANVSEVTLEFGVNISADAGIPYIAGGKAQSNLKITVKCSFDQEKSALEQPATNGNGASAFPPPPPPASQMTY